MITKDKLIFLLTVFHDFRDRTILRTDFKIVLGLNLPIGTQHNGALFALTFCNYPDAFSAGLVAQLTLNTRSPL